jgi:hypothetical protein
MIEELSSSETSALTRVTRRNIPEDDILVTAVKTSNLIHNLLGVLSYVQQNRAHYGVPSRRENQMNPQTLHSYCATAI